MKKTMKQQLEEIIAVTEEQQGLKGLPKELKEVKQQIKNLLTVIKITMGMAIIFTALLTLGCIGIALNNAITPDPEAGKLINTAIQGIIISATVVYITVVCKGFCEDIIKSSTPFIPQVPKGLRKISTAISVMIILSLAEGAVYAKIADAEFTSLVSGMTGWIFVLMLTILSYIFDYGCKLQQESDETI